MSEKNIVIKLNVSDIDEFKSKKGEVAYRAKGKFFEDKDAANKYVVEEAIQSLISDIISSLEPMNYSDGVDELLVHDAINELFAMAGDK